MAQFLSLSSLPAEDQAELLQSSARLHHTVPALFPPPHSVDPVSLARNSVTFSTVRHPFLRLVSAYQVEYQALLQDHLTKSLKDKIVDGRDSSFRRLRARLAARPGGATFPNFVSHVLERVKRRCPSLHNCSLNLHWLPFTSRCQYCTIPYTAIARLETLDTDLKVESTYFEHY